MNPMVSRIRDWFTSRWPYYPLKHILLDEEIPGGARFAYTLGAGILTLLSLQIVSGIIQLFYYVPAVDHAYDSVSYLRTEVPFGWLFHNIHYWGANLMVVLVALHMMRVYIWGAYKTQLTWLIGVGLLVMTMALTFTGAPLIWDQRGYWAGEVGSSITGTVPVKILYNSYRDACPFSSVVNRHAYSCVPRDRSSRALEGGKEKKDGSFLA